MEECYKSGCFSGSLIAQMVPNLTKCHIYVSLRFEYSWNMLFAEDTWNWFQSIEKKIENHWKHKEKLIHIKTMFLFFRSRSQISSK